MRVEEIKSSRKKIAISLLSSFGLVLISFAINTEGVRESVIYRFCGMFFILISVKLVYLLIRPRSLFLTPSGFTITRGLFRSPKHVLWRDVSPLFTYHLATGAKLIGYNFTPGALKDSARLGVNRLLGADGWLPRGWSESPDRIVELINAYREQALAEDSNSEARAV